ncbi:MAG: hypothetical protein VYA34_08090 [Myxococcota bacterium]|nr:hypothetical protein [Myxococcota bacterium]
MLLAGFVIIQVLTISAIMMGAELTEFVNPPSLILTFVGGHAAMLGAHGIDAFRILLPGFSESPEYGAIIAQTGRKGYVIAGWLGVLIGFIQMCNSGEDFLMVDPQGIQIFNIEVLCGAQAVLMLCPFYGHLMDLACWMPLEQAMKTKIERN